MVQTALSNPEVIVNNIRIEIVPNTLKYQLGITEYNTRATDAGTIVATKNLETAIGGVTFSVYSTVENEQLIETWKLNFNLNVIELTQPNFTKIFQEAILMQNIEIEVGSDSSIELEFKSRPAI